jgi:TetR/AcrR family transcriptional regulator, cholesterol catabolism regulator
MLNTDNNNIVTAAVGLFMQYGFKSVTVDDVAKAAGISKKTLYQVFADKDELVLAALKSHLEFMENNFVRIVNSNKNAIDQTLDCMVLMEGELSVMNPVCPVDLERYYPKAQLFMNNFITKVMTQTLEKNLNKGIAEAYFRADIDVKFCAQFRIETEFLLMYNPLFNKNKRKIIQYHRESLVQFLYGIATIKGHKLIEKKLKELA